MTQGVLDLIQAIDSGDSTVIDAAFNAEMAERVSSKLDDMRVDIAHNLFRETTEETIEEQVELSDEDLTEEILNEVLGKNEPAGAWIKDFVDSENPKFEGKSKEQRKKMALAAYYAKQKNEELDVAEVLDYLSEDEEVLTELSKATLVSYAKAAKKSADKHNKLAHKADLSYARSQDTGRYGVDKDGRDSMERALHHDSIASKRNAGFALANKKLASK